MQDNVEKKRAIPEERVYPKNKAKSIRDVGSTFAGWETISTVPRSNGGKVSLKDTPYKSRLK